MADIYLVRHGQAAGHWSEDLDPLLSSKGKKQAHEAAYKLKNILSENEHLDHIQCISSPLKRAHETAQHFSTACQKDITIAKAVSEMPTPLMDMNERSPWLMSIMNDSWPNLSPLLNKWREDCLDFVLGLNQDSVIFSHYVVINVLIGQCLNKDKVINYHPDNCSIHHFNNDQGLNIVSLGDQAQTKVN